MRYRKFSSQQPRRRRVAISEVPTEKVWRFYLVRTFLILAILTIFVRLVQIQVIDNKKYIKLAKEQYTRILMDKAERGLIYDRNMMPVALNRACYDIGLHRRQAKDLAATSQKLAKILDLNQRALYAKIRDGNDFIMVARKVEKEKVSLIQLLNIPGISIAETSERIYPLNDKLAQVIGFVDVDGRGISGLELAYDTVLTGKDGKSLYQKDAKGNFIAPIVAETEKQKSGKNLILTIDNVLQTIAEDELNRTVKKFNAKGGSVIITDPNTGEILALASAPGFDANNAKNYPPENWRIRAITDIFEPGSTYKIVTMMAAITEGKKDLNDIVYCENGKVTMFGEEINDSKKHAWLTVRKVFTYSSNIGTAKIAREVGKDALFNASRYFGFGIKTGIELPGEVGGILKKPFEWSDFSLAAISYGHEVAVTPLQVAMAYGAIANGGKLMKPMIIKEIRNQENKIVASYHPQKIRQVMDKTSAVKMIDILEEVVEMGTGTSAKIPNLKIAGKTGTAQKPLRGRLGYSDSKFVASFAGFYPAENARLLIYINIDEPFPVHSGGNVAAPAFRNILQQILKIYAQPVKRHYAEATPAPQILNTRLIPDLQGRRIETALHILKDLDIQPEIEGEGDIVEHLKLVIATEKNKKPQIRIKLTSFPDASGYTTMPDLRGFSLRKAVTELTIRGLKVKIYGEGKVVRQEPAVGTKLKVGARCMIECAPRINIQKLNQS
ncbi:MAG: penicillin-binding transpeptidase domain-containing protein [bacterium]